MENNNNFDLFYDVLDASIRLLYVFRHDNFFNLLIDTGKNIIAGEVLDQEIPDNIRTKLLDLLAEEPTMVLSTAYAYAKNYVLYGEDITKAFQEMTPFE